MKIERISDTQIKFILSHADLAERNIKINELSYGSDKSQRLFQEMMFQAMTEYDFETENVPLMVEAAPLGADGVMVVVTKLRDSSEAEVKLNLFPLAKAALRFKKKELIEPPEESPEEDSISVFSFDSLDELAEASARLFGKFTGVSKVYKMDGQYFLMLQNETEDERTTADLESILFEYGQKHISNAISRHYLSEHAESIITEHAVDKMTGYYKG